MRLKLTLLLLLGEFGRAGISFASGTAGSGPESPFAAVVPILGAMTFICLLTTLTIGLLFHRKRPQLFPWHRRMAITTIFVAVSHLTAVLIFH